MAGIESELREIRKGLAELNLKVDELLEERGTHETIGGVPPRLPERGARALLRRGHQGTARMKGKFVLIPFPFTDLTPSKLRPFINRPLTSEEELWERAPYF